MATVTVKNIPDELYQQLKSLAERNRRSINSQIIVCLEKALTSRRLTPDEAIDTARKLRQLTAEAPIDDQEFNRLKSQGRS